MGKKIKNKNKLNTKIQNGRKIRSRIS